MLTRKQFELLTYIDQYLNSHGISPSFDEMKDALDLRSKSGIHRLITALEERGFIRRLAHRARALEVLKLPAAAGQDLPTPSAPNVIRGDFAPAKGKKPREATVTLPLYGRIAAGQPIEAIADQSETIDVPATLLSGGEHFALEVSGDSMIEAGILDGDTAIIRRADSAENGSIVVALVDNEETTLKRLRRRGNSVALEPANQDYETKIFPPDRVHIQGRMVALIRVY